MVPLENDVAHTWMKTDVCVRTFEPVFLCHIERSVINVSILDH